MLMLMVVEHEREADAGSLEHVDNDLAALRRLRALAHRCRRLLVQCDLARLLCRVLPDVPWCCSRPRDVQIGQ